MTLKEIFHACDYIGFLTFATIDGNFPATRIAHFFAYDQEGLYFKTMNTKPFYHQLITHKTVSVCGLFADYGYEEDNELPPPVEGNYSIRITGEVKTVSPDALRKKAKKDPLFTPAVEDMEKYRTMRTFVLHKGFGEIFNYDFEEEFSDRKLERTYFSFNGLEAPLRGLQINQERCSNCGACADHCLFNAITKGAKGYQILNQRCDACGDCSVICPEKAVDIKVE